MTVLLTLMLAGVLSPDLNYLVVDVRTRQVVEQDWPGADQPIPVGSLVKPFTALAFSGPFPEFTCHGAADRCWLAKGHGREGFPQALAHSCNAYFLNLARAVQPDSLAVVAANFGIPPPDADTPEARIGLGTDWKISPLALTRAYCELTARSGDPRVTDILAGLKLAAESGTASVIGRGALAKTGTAPCVARLKHAGDGFALVLAPADAPRIAILVRVHGVPGADAAKSAAAILKRAQMIVAICVFSLFHPTELVVQPAPANIVVIMQNGRPKTLEGSAAISLRGPATASGRDGAETAFFLNVPGKIRREFRGRLEVRAEAGHLIAIVTMDRENAVASIVAAESPPGAPLEARKAQAVVARSFLIAARARHVGFDFCDTTHCQFLREIPPAGSLSAMAEEQTRGLVIAYQGRAIAALYSANCGGRTRNLADAGWNAEPYPYFAVDCPVRGPVSGHRIGMCQEGAARMARQGKTFREIIAAYFPATSIIRAFS